MTLRATWGVLRESPNFIEHEANVDAVNVHIRGEGVASADKPEVYMDKCGDEWLIFWTGFHPMNPFVPEMSSEAVSIAWENYTSSWVAYASEAGEYVSGYLGYYMYVQHRVDAFMVSANEPSAVVRKVWQGRDSLIALLKRCSSE